MHIAFVTPAYPPLPGGGERFVRSLAAVITAAGHRVSVVTSAATAEAQLWDGATVAIGLDMEERDRVSIARVPIRGFPFGRRGLMLWRKGMVVVSALPGDGTRPLLRAARQIPRLQGMEAVLDALEGVELVHAFNLSWEGAMAAAYSYARRKRMPLVITPFAHLGVGNHDRVARNSTMDHQLAMLRAAAGVMALTGIERNGLASYGVPRERVTVIGGGIDPLPGDIDHSPYARSQNPDAPEPFALFIGRLSFDKGAIHAADAVLELCRRGKSLTLLLVGAMHPEFERYYRRLGAAERARVRPLGSLAERDKHALLSRARCLLLPSRSDSFGIVLLEAWAHDTPVVAARAGGIPGVVDDGVNGLLVPFGDVKTLAAAVERLLTDPALARRLGLAGHDKVMREYSWESVAARVIAGYERALAAGGA